MKVLIASKYVDPNSTGTNNNVLRQAISLKKDFSVDIEILTWPFNDNWSDAIPEINNELEIIREGINYNVINPTFDWSCSPGVIDDKEWANAVSYGIKLLTKIKPDILHLHHRHAFWWILESAQRLNIKTVYTTHDWGVLCLRTVLVMGDGKLCNGDINREKCEKCVLQGRNGLGKINEFVVNTNILYFFTNRLFKITAIKKYLQSKYAILIPIKKRLNIHFNRVERTINKTNAIIVPYEFGKILFSNFTDSTNNIFVLPWFSNPEIINVNKRKTFTVSYIGRVSPEKSLHLVLESLKKIPLDIEIILNITGKNSSQYCLDLLKKYPTKVNNVQIYWLDWVKPSFIYNNSDIILVTTGCMECGPFTLFEALSYKVPVIATNIPPIKEIVEEGLNGYLVDFNSSDAIADAFVKAYNDFIKNKFLNFNFPKINTINEYCIEIFNIYKRILK